MPSSPPPLITPSPLEGGVLGGVVEGWPAAPLLSPLHVHTFAALLNGMTDTDERVFRDEAARQEQVNQEDFKQTAEQEPPEAKIDASVPMQVMTSEVRGEVTTGGNQAPQAGIDTPDLQSIAQQLLKGLSVQQLDQGTTLHLELTAKRFSRLGLDLQLIRGRIEARFMVADEREGALLRSAVAALPTELQGRGLPLDGVMVDLGSRSGQRERQDPEQDRCPAGPRAARGTRGRSGAKARADGINYEV